MTVLEILNLLDKLQKVTLVIDKKSLEGTAGTHLALLNEAALGAKVDHLNVALNGALQIGASLEKRGGEANGTIDT